MNSILSFVATGLTYIIVVASAHADEYVIREFQKQEMTPIYWSEGAAIGDFNNDSNPDIVVDPTYFWDQTLIEGEDLDTNSIRPKHQHGGIQMISLIMR